MSQIKTQNAPMSAFLLTSLAMLFIAVSCSKPKPDKDEPHNVVKTEPVIPDGFVKIPAGSFAQGSPETEEGRYAIEMQREVTISRPFLLQAKPVTQGEWREVMGSNPSHFSGIRECGDNCPVESVNWFDAVTYLNRLSERDGLEACYTLSGCSGEPGGGCENRGNFCDGDYTCEKVISKGLSCAGYRLPTEAEWEYAARAGTSGAIYGMLANIAWYNENADYKTHPVGQKQANAWGLYDMIGNVWEWTEDSWSGAAYETGNATDPLVPGPDNRRVVRGCFYGNLAKDCRAANRYSESSILRSREVGMRGARSIP